MNHHLPYFADVRQALSSKASATLHQTEVLDLDTFPWIDWPF